MFVSDISLEHLLQLLLYSNSTYSKIFGKNHLKFIVSRIFESTLILFKKRNNRLTKINREIYRCAFFSVSFARRKPKCVDSLKNSQYNSLSLRVKWYIFSAAVWVGYFYSYFSLTYYVTANFIHIDLKLNLISLIKKYFVFYDPEINKIKCWIFYT